MVVTLFILKRNPALFNKDCRRSKVWFDRIKILKVIIYKVLEDLGTVVALPCRFFFHKPKTIFFFGKRNRKHCQISSRGKRMAEAKLQKENLCHFGRKMQLLFVFQLLSLLLAVAGKPDTTADSSKVYDPNYGHFDTEVDKCTTIIVGAKAGVDGPITSHTADCADCDFRLGKVFALYHIFVLSIVTCLSIAEVLMLCCGHTALYIVGSCSRLARRFSAPSVHLPRSLPECSKPQPRVHLESFQPAGHPGATDCVGHREYHCRLHPTGKVVFHAWE
jgi:hypothetical protein